ncbi:PTS galactosamine/N-acetylgalactosamine transporter subunit IIA [Sporolactobacillus sp. KGMB 08714]|uniref:PTS galactosamine/N-acetylgalactosamine transporter subunit IIA n=1 Tax=Sporolactobacillus sp. KGMB 08714 TaxID=3064704 RepID=UPI002FBDFC52
MIGIVLTGHGNFASGIYSTIQLLGGEQEKFVPIDFTKGMTADELHQKFETAIQRMDSSEGIIFFTDIPGGTPFNQAAASKFKHQNIEILSGTNIPMLMEIVFQRSLNMERFIKVAVTAGQDGIVRFHQRCNKKQNNEEEGKEGI